MHFLHNFALTNRSVLQSRSKCPPTEDIVLTNNDFRTLQSLIRGDPCDLQVTGTFPRVY